MTFSQESINLDKFKYDLDIINLYLLVPTAIVHLTFTQRFRINLTE